MLSFSPPNTSSPHPFELTSSHSAIANQESLSGLETEMRKLEGLVKEIVDEMGYLKKREERFADTNRASTIHNNFILMRVLTLFCFFSQSQLNNASKILPGSRSSRSPPSASGRSSTSARFSGVNTLLISGLMRCVVWD
jgi:hypothetical protein